MSKQYASSVYSHKSTSSAKSGKSFLSFTSSNKKNGWGSLKYWMPSVEKKKTNDTDSIATRSLSIKFKQLFTSNKNSSIITSSPSLSLIDDNTTSSTLEEEPETKKHLNGILINHNDNSLEAKKRRTKRKENILKLQKQHCFKDKVKFHKENNDDEQSHTNSLVESSSSDTLFSNTDDTTTIKKKSVSFVNQYSDEEEDTNTMFNPRIMFIEHSPVPRFRNVAPPPPPSPPYMNIIVHQDSNDTCSIITNENEPTVYVTPTTMTMDGHEQDQEHDRNMSLLIESLLKPQRPKIYFHSPLYRGQTIQFSLRNMIPEDHIILFKFLTTSTIKGQPERYFVRPSAGKISADEKQADILLFLNQVPTTCSKDKLIVRWAPIQRNSAIEKWVYSLEESTRRKWLDMLEEQWPDQVTIRMTRIKIRFK